MKTRLLSEPFDAVIMSGKMPSDWNAKEAYLWLKQNCSGHGKACAVYVLQRRGAGR